MKRRLLFCLTLLTLLVSAMLAHAAPAVALFYGSNAPYDALKAFDIVVLDPDHHPTPNALRKPYSEPYAYVAVGEAHPTRPYFKDIPDAARLAVNKDWGSLVIDLSHPGWADFLATNIVTPLWDKGYRGFFLDTLDSYRLAAKFDEAAQQAGLVAVIETLHRRFPGIRLILNRGFDIVPKVRDKIEMVAAESLFQGWDAAAQRYVEIKEADRAWLLGELLKVRDTYKLPVLAIDYVAPQDRALTRATAEKIKALGIVPWVADGALGTLGIGQREVVPRTIAVIYDSREAPALNYTNAHRFLEMPLNHLGYSAEYFDINQPLPTNLPVGRYAGIAVWLSSTPNPVAPFTGWILRQIGNGTAVAFLGQLNLSHDSRTLKRLGLSSVSAPTVPQLHVASADPMFRGEAPLQPDHRSLDPIRLTDPNTALVTLSDQVGSHYTAAALTQWGGFVLDPFVVKDIPGTEQARWHFDPFLFLRAALKLPPMPVPDTTTENGRRLLTVHIDGDGFPSRAEIPGTPLAGRVLLDQFLTRYRIPHAMSVIEAEVAPHGLHSSDAAEMEEIARRMFALPHVEIASHTFSHPFRWDNTVKHGIFKDAGADEIYHLDIPGYTFDLTREIAGSLEYIRNRLAPKGKPVKLLFWSGDTAPGVDALELADRAGVLNINGGTTQITRSNPSLTAISSIGITKGGHRQIYAPVTNENLYTNLWTGPYYGFRRVIETFQMTESPRRLKPIGIYYHSYSASKKASIEALHEVYRWALAQTPHPVFISEYIRKALDFDEIVVARENDAWRIRGNGDLRTVRAPDSLGIPDAAGSQAVAGHHPGSEGNYVHLVDGDALLRFSTSPSRPAAPYLREANARIADWQAGSDSLRFTLKGHQPLEFTLAASPRCSVSIDGKPLKPRRVNGDLLEFRLSDAAATIETRCRDR